jgi:hypothetical protein
MAMVIPPEGDTQDLPGPSDETAIHAILGSESIKRWNADDGSVWWYVDPPPPGSDINLRANKFISIRQGPRNYTPDPFLYGNVLYVSPDEMRKFNHTREVWVPVRGRTFPVKDALKAIGARWDPNTKLWSVPQSKLAQAEDIVRKGP